MKITMKFKATFEIIVDTLEYDDVKNGEDVLKLAHAMLAGEADLPQESKNINIKVTIA